MGQRDKFRPAEKFTALGHGHKHGKLTSVVRFSPVDDRVDRYDPVRVNGFMAAVVVTDDMIEICRLGGALDLI